MFWFFPDVYRPLKEVPANLLLLTHHVVEVAGFRQRSATTLRLLCFLIAHGAIDGLSQVHCSPGLGDGLSQQLFAKGAVLDTSEDEQVTCRHRLAIRLGMGSCFLDLLFGEGVRQAQRSVDKAFVELEVFFDN